MTTKVSTIYDQMIARVGSVLSSHVRLPNPYKPVENPELFLKQGFGVAFGAASVEGRSIGGMVRMRRDFMVIITRKFFAKEIDGARKAITEKQVLEDMFSLIKDFELNGVLSGHAIKSDFVSDGGIEYVAREKDQFLMAQATFSVEYFEDLNG